MMRVTIPAVIVVVGVLLVLTGSADWIRVAGAAAAAVAALATVLGLVAMRRAHSHV